MPDPLADEPALLEALRTGSGASGSSSAAAAALGNRQPREVRPPRPSGMSREAYALLDG